MRLRKLNLDYFGHFTDKALDFGEARPGIPDFHIVYGPNEAGKTTTMEGFLRLLYGFEHREPYDFQHQRKNLRVSGVIDLNGEETFFARLPTRAGSLIDANGHPLPETALQGSLAGLGQEDYRKLLCLDDETIERGGEEIASSKGDIGRLLFSAAAGVNDLSERLATVEEQARALYLKGSSKAHFASLKKELDETSAQIKALDVPASAYRKLKTALDEAKAEEMRATEARKSAFAEKTQLQAIHDALPMLDRIDRLADELAPVAHYPERLDIHPDLLVRMLADRETHRARIEQLSADIAAQERELGAITLAPERLPLGPALAPLGELNSRFVTAEVDLPKRRRVLAEAVSDMTAVAASLGLEGEVSSTLLVLAQPDLARLETAREALLDAQKALAREQLEQAGLSDRLQEARMAADKAEAATLPDQDLATFWHSQVGPKLVEDHAVAANAVKTARHAYLASLKALTVKGQAFDGVPIGQLTVREAETLGRDIAETRTEHDQLLDERDQLKRQLARISTQIEALKAAHQLVSDSESRTARADRDRLWAEHRQTLSAESALPFETAMQTLDGMFERRLLGAEAVGQLRQLEQDALDRTAKLAEAESRLEKLTAALARLQTQAEKALQGSGLTVDLSLESYVDWLRQCDAAAKAKSELDLALDDRRPVLDTAARHGAQLKTLLNVAHEDFDTLYALGQERVRDHRARLEIREKALSRLADLQAEAERREAALDRMSAARDHAATEWARLIADLLPPGLAPETLLPSLDPLRQLREIELGRKQAERQVDAMAQDQASFAEQLAILSTRFGLPVPDDVSEAYARLAAAAEHAKKADDEARRLSGVIEDNRQKLEQARQLLEEIAHQIAALGQAFDPAIPTDTLEDLRQAVSTSARVIDSRRRLAEMTGDLLVRLSVKDLEAVRVLLADYTLLDVAARLDAIERDLQEFEERYRQAIARRAEAESGLRAVTGDADVAVLVERRRTIELEMQETILSYLELRFGHQLAEEAIRRYRDRHRSGMLEATEKAFADLTNGAYTKLRTQPEGNAEVLMALSAEGTPKRAQDMSKGTRFQLYLALRAAAYEQMAASGHVLPFFCDDIFETFDEERTRAACHLMARIGATGQAIYLTHHRHVVEIARQVCGDDVRVHEIG
ncbi:ATP-binding protein [Rhizobium halophytocola]|uniref:Uncharacterized protein YhaN n=1 Tax=Rhizobium halophytocola TaxID=735519 RepID=A0ABS4DVE0_9HYPH|nr:uncharacterized protein YhaN [Rhizobium halophytocola]